MPYVGPALAGLLSLGALIGADPPARAHVFSTIEVTPEDDWCDVVQYAAANGDLVRLAAGDYPGDCFILKSGLPEEGEPLAIVAAGDGPVRMLGVSGRPVVTVFGNYVRLGGIHFVPAPDQPSVVGRGRSLLVDGCTFEGGSVGLDMATTTGGISIIDNLFEDVAAPIRSLCPEDDVGCDKTRAVLRDNVFRSRARHLGCAVSVLARADLLAEANVVEGRWECGLDLRSPTGPIDVRHNAILGGDVGIALAGEVTASIVNNIVVDTTSFSIALAPATVADKGGVDVAGNTLVPATGRLVDDPDERARRAGNAVLPTPEDATQDGGDDVACADPEDCWVAPERGDFRPRAGSPLIDRGPPLSVTTVDFCGASRRPTSAAGAIAAADATPMRLQPVSRSKSGCLAAGHIDPGLMTRGVVPLDGPTFMPIAEPDTAGCLAQPPWAGGLALLVCAMLRRHACPMRVRRTGERRAARPPST